MGCFAEIGWRVYGVYALLFIKLLPLYHMQKKCASDMKLVMNKNQSGASWIVGVWGIALLAQIDAKSGAAGLCGNQKSQG